MREVNHRSKNLLSLVQGIAHLTASTGAQDFIQRFGARIQSLSAAQDLLIRSEWKAVPLNISRLLSALAFRRPDRHAHRNHRTSAVDHSGCLAGHRHGVARAGN